jgi:hypothetical protein
MKGKELNVKDLGPQLLAAFQKLNRYAGILILLLVAGVYGFVLLRINQLSNVQPSESDISAQSASATIPKVDPHVVNQLESMKDNSVNVQTLFDQARGNPFSE